MSDRVRLSTIIPVQYLWDSRTLIKNDFRNIIKQVDRGPKRLYITANSLLAGGSLSCDDTTTPHVATIANSKYIGQRRRNYNSENSAAKDSG